MALGFGDLPPDVQDRLWKEGKVEWDDIPSDVQDRLIREGKAPDHAPKLPPPKPAPPPAVKPPAKPPAKKPPANTPPPAPKPSPPAPPPGGTAAGQGSGVWSSLSGSKAAKQTTTVANKGAGVLLGAVAYAVGINWLRYGWTGVSGWFQAKFFNEPVSGPWGTVASSGGGSSALKTVGGITQKEWAQIQKLEKDGDASSLIPASEWAEIKQLGLANTSWKNLSAADISELDSLSGIDWADLKKLNLKKKGES